MVLAQDLRDAVLQAALQGKLTKQLETDSSVELQSVDNEILDNIPENWRLVEVNTIIEIRNGFTPKRTIAEFWDKQEIPWFTVEDVNEQGHIITYTKQFITTKALGTSKTRKIPKHTVLLCCTSATIGNYALTEIELITNQQWNGLVIKDNFKNIILAEYILCWVQTLKEKMISKGGSTTFPFLSTKKLGKFLIPLPPIEEQQRIVNRINELMKKIDEYEKVEKELVALEQKFPDDMKNALLQAAMQGKLTEQLDTDSSVDEMLEDEDVCLLDIKNYPYTIPRSWKFAKMGELTVIPVKRGKSPKYVNKSGILVFAQKCNQKVGGISLQDAKYLDESIKNKYKEENYLKGNDIVINSTGGGTLGRIGYITEELVSNSLPIVPDSHVTTIRTKKNILSKYIFLFLKFNQSYLESMGVGSTNQTELKPDTIKELLVPIPPIEEQQRIIEKMEQLLPLCETL